MEPGDTTPQEGRREFCALPSLCELAPPMPERSASSTSNLLLALNQGGARQRLSTIKPGTAIGVVTDCDGDALAGKIGVAVRMSPETPSRTRPQNRLQTLEAVHCAFRVLLGRRPHHNLPNG
jgi:hypothetical protein